MIDSIKNIILNSDNINYKTISIKFVLFSFLFSILVLHSISYSYEKINKNDQNLGFVEDLEHTYEDFSKRPEDVLDGEFIVVGDSFAYLLTKYSKKTFGYSVHQGFVVESISENLIEDIPNGCYKYCFVFIGPNDFMNHTEGTFFQNQLFDIIFKLNSKGIKAIFTDYYEPNLFDDRCRNLITPVNCDYYDYLLKFVISRTNSIFVPSRDLFEKYRWMENDFVHPSKELYDKLLDRVIESIS